MQNKKSGEEIKITLNRKPSQSDMIKIREMIENAVKYVQQKSGSENFMGSISQRDGNSRPVLYTHEKPAPSNQPVNLAGSPPPVGTTGQQKGV